MYERCSAIFTSNILPLILNSVSFPLEPPRALVSPHRMLGKRRHGLFPLRAPKRKRATKRAIAFRNRLAECAGNNAPPGGKRDGKAVSLVEDTIGDHAPPDLPGNPEDAGSTPRENTTRNLNKDSTLQYGKKLGNGGYAFIQLPPAANNLYIRYADLPSTRPIIATALWKMMRGASTKICVCCRWKR